MIQMSYRVMPQNDWDDRHAANHIEVHLLRHFQQDEAQLFLQIYSIVGCAEIQRATRQTQRICDGWFLAMVRCSLEIRHFLNT